jgi:3-methyladenine DNA glycosylase AlkD
MGPRYGIVTADRVFGVPMARIQAIAKPLGKDNDLAAAMWATRVYEGRMIAFLIDDPAMVTHAQMDAWRAQFDNWAVTDTACFKLFDKVEGAAALVEPWTQLNDEMGRRAGFALLACLALHRRPADYLHGLALIEGAAEDDRNFVKKGANWALRAIGGKKDPALRAAARALATKLAVSTDRTARWNGKDALRAFAKADAKNAAAS